MTLRVSGAEARRSRMIDRRSLLTPYSLESHNPLTDDSGADVRCRSGHGKAKPQPGRISALAGRQGRLRACYSYPQPEPLTATQKFSYIIHY